MIENLSAYIIWSFALVTISTVIFYLYGFSLSDTIYTLARLNRIVSYEEPEAFAKAAVFVPLENPLGVPPSNDVVIPAPPRQIPAVGGL